MKYIIVILFPFFIVVFLVACGQSPKNAESIPSDSSVLDLSEPYKSPKPRLSFQLASVLPQFGDEPGFRELESYQIAYDADHFYSYSVYQLPKQRVEDLLAKNPIVVLQYANGKKLYAELEKMKIDSFLKQHVIGIEYENAADFYSKALRKNVEVYSYNTAQHFHYLFFDTVANMVYHRMKAVAF